MASALFGDNFNYKRIGFVALIFATLFFASSLGAYRLRGIEEDYVKSIRNNFERLPELSSDAAEIEAVVLSACSTDFNETRESAARVGDSYQKALAHLAEAVQVSESYNEGRVIRVAAHGYVVTYAHLNNDADAYFYQRLLLEKQRQEMLLSKERYVEARRALAMALLAYEYASHEHASLGTVSSEHSFESQLEKAKGEVTQLRTEVASLKEQLASVERSRFEKLITIVVAVVTLLLALSSHVIAWRADRRQAREAQLIALRRQKLEQNLIQKTQLIRETKAQIIKPTSYELQLYSKPQTSRNIASSS